MAPPKETRERKPRKRRPRIVYQGEIIPNPDPVSAARGEELLVAWLAEVLAETK